MEPWGPSSQPSKSHASSLVRAPASAAATAAGALQGARQRGSEVSMFVQARLRESGRQYHGGQAVGSKFDSWSTLQLEVVWQADGWRVARVRALPPLVL